ncbi:MAG: 50S ribosomal protein L15 [Acidimicrobiia bacterium]|nr:50S ribosomal protein L15 [Acidimicrobiia bacterium]
MADEQLRLHDLAPAEGAKKKKIRVGRGEGGRRGKTAGRGTKGAKARGSLPPWFEGGRTPIHRQLPHLPGFNNPNRVEYNPVNVGSLEVFAAGTEITPDVLRSSGLAKKKGLVKILGDGDLSVKLIVKTHAVSASAKAKIEAAGGSVELIER